MHKPMRVTRNDGYHINLLAKQDSRIEKESETVFYAYKDVADELRKAYREGRKETTAVDWKTAAGFRFDYQIAADNEPPSEMRTFTLDDDDYELVAESFKRQLGLTRVRFSYLTRLCLLIARKKLSETAPIAPVEIDKLDGVRLIRRLTELLEDPSEEACRKIKNIKNILEEE